MTDGVWDNHRYKEHLKKEEQEKQIERDRQYIAFEDMSPRGRLSLTMQDDGDIIVHAIDENGRGVAVEFCTTMGGGKYPHTRNALQNVIEAMIKDGVEPA
jgi:hypothetical protein